MERVSLDFQGEHYAFDLDHEHGHWTELEPQKHQLLDESDFPLVATADGKRYEIYSDGSFANVEVP